MSFPRTLEPKLQQYENKYVLYHESNAGKAPLRLYVGKGLTTRAGQLISRMDFIKAIDTIKGEDESKEMDGASQTIALGTSGHISLNILVRERSKLNCWESTIVAAEDLYRKYIA